MGERTKKKADAAAPEPRDAKLFIPTENLTSGAYKERLGDLLARSDTHVYIDTSFLMWATKIGPASRSELLGWFKDDLGGRAHVPTWSAHEYLRHHVAGTIVDELKAESVALAKIAKNKFAYFRPFLDNPALPANTGFDRLRSSTRDAINTLGQLARAAENWGLAYPAHAEQIIQFINDRVLGVGDLYDLLPEIRLQGEARYEGRIPPGFQDRNKKGDQHGEAPEPLNAAGANRYGDLIFWKETLADAAARGAAALIVLSNDRKNDWRMGGETRAAIDASMLALRKSWRPVPRIHPMLALEGKRAGIPDVSLVDSQYLAAYLRHADASRVVAFADVAIVPDPLPAARQDDGRAAAIAQRAGEDERGLAEASREREERAANDGYLFPDDPAVGTTAAALARALYLSRDGADARGMGMIDQLDADQDAATTVREAFAQQALVGMDHLALTAVGRSLHDRAIATEPGATEAVVDLIPLLDELPPRTAGAMALGLLASMYLERGSGESRIPPCSPADRLLLALTRSPFAEQAVKTVAKRLNGNLRRPLHVPATEPVQIGYEFDIESETMEQDELRSLKIMGVETLTRAQADPGLRLRDMIGRTVASGGDILEIATRLLVLPQDLLILRGDEGAEYFLTETIGFRSPGQVFMQKDET